MGYKNYNEDYQASCLIMLEAADYPYVRGALERVSRTTKVSTQTLRRWWKGESNPVPANVVAQKKGTVVEKLDNTVHMILDSIDLDTIEAAPLRERTTALGIVIDKQQLLSGGPTERTAADHTHHITENVDRSEYDNIIREAESIINETASST